MSKTPPAAPVDYEGLWSTYSRWKQEDKQWYENQKKLYSTNEAGQTAAESSTRARLASSGIAEGSESWERQMNKMKAEIPDYEAEYAKRQNTLLDSTIHETLFGDKSPVHGVISLSSEENKSINIQEWWESRGGEGEINLSNSEDLIDWTEWINKESDFAKTTQELREKEYDKMFGTPEVANIYEPSAEQKVQNDAGARAKAAASGRKGVGGGGDDDEGASPWI